MPSHKIPHPDRESVRKHKREYLLQILLPIVLTTVVVVGLVVFLATYTLTSGGALGNMKDISLIWMMLPLLISALVVLAVMVLAIYGMGVFLGKTEPVTGMIQQKVYRFNDSIRAGADRVVRPVINAKAWMNFLSRRKG